MSTNPYKKHKIDDRILTQVMSWVVGFSTNTHTPFVRVTLAGGITWTGWLKSPKSKEIALKGLQVMGFKGSTLGMLKEDNALDKTRDVIAVIGEIRPYNGKTYYDAKFINRAPKMGFSEDKKSAGIMDELDKIDTRGVIEDATDISTPAVSGRALADTFDDGFNPEEIPF